jgi:4-hydroxybenzoate polyprenyltransferase
MAKFGKRTWRYLAAIWIVAIAAELVLLEMARRTYDSWLLLLALAILVVPIAVTVRTYDWLARAPRKRWKRHDVEDEVARAAATKPVELRGAAEGRTRGQ